MQSPSYPFHKKEIHVNKENNQKRIKGPIYIIGTHLINHDRIESNHQSNPYA